MMEKLIIRTNGSDSLIGPEGRAAILAFEKTISKHPDAMFGDNAEMPLKHSFAPGMYVREIFIPKGSVLTGKIHRHAHPNFLMKGEVIVVTEHGGREHLKAPMSIISKAGTKRAIMAIEDTTWITVHATDEQDLKKIEDYVIAPSYEAYELEQKQLSMSELEAKNCLILALKDNKKDHKCLLILEPIGTLLPFKASLEVLKAHNIDTNGMLAHKKDNGIWHVLPAEKGNLDDLDLNDFDMVGSWVATAVVGGSAVIGGVTSYLSSENQADTARNASNTQLQSQLDALRQARAGTNTGYRLARKQFEESKKILMDLSNPNSQFAQQQRAAFGKTLGQNLAARGLTGSGAEIAGLSDFELGLSRERQNNLLNLANLRTGFGNLGASLYSQLGANNANILTQGGNAQANLALQQGQATSQGYTGIGNSLQTGLLGLGQLNQQRQQQDFIKSLFSGNTSSSSTPGGDVFTPNYRFR